MKKKLSILLSVLMVLSLLCLAGCGGNKKKQEAVDAFNSVSKDFNEVANMINETRISWMRK